MKKIILILAVLLIVWLIPIKNVYKDWGTRSYSAFLYKYIKWSKKLDCETCVKPYYKENELIFFPYNFKNLDDYWKNENIEKIPKLEDKSIVYSNLLDETSQEKLKKLLQKYNISEKNIDKFLYYVNLFNDDVKWKNLVKTGFSPYKNVDYDETLYKDFISEKYQNFIGTNCRVSSFSLLQDLLSIEHWTEEEPWNLVLDGSSIEDAPEKLYNNSEKEKFYAFFSQIPTPLTKDINIHIKNIQNYWKEKWVKFTKQEGISFISVFFHDDLDNILFIWHAGILLQDADKLYFLEKLSFNLPYQLLIFHDKTQLNKYLMEKYDTAYNMPTAHPFIMENDDLMKEYKVLEK